MPFDEQVLLRVKACGPGYRKARQSPAKPNCAAMARRLMFTPSRAATQVSQRQRLMQPGMHHRSFPARPLRAASPARHRPCAPESTRHAACGAHWPVRVDQSTSRGWTLPPRCRRIRGRSPPCGWTKFPPPGQPTAGFPIRYGRGTYRSLQRAEPL